MSKLMRIGFIGGGKMAQALAKGFIAAGLTKGELITSSCHPSDLASAQVFKAMGAQSHFENLPVVQNADVIWISVKPSIVPEALAAVKKHSNTDWDSKTKLFISIAMGVTIAQLEKCLPSGTRVMRVMPNTPALVRSGASVVVSGSCSSEQDIVTAQSLLESVGSCEVVPESYLDAITAVSGSGPAYVYVAIEAIADGGVKMGLPRDLAYRLAAQTVMGAGKMVRKTGTHPGILKDDVTSPAGSTATALHYLESKGFRAALIGAIEAATERCRQVANK